MLLTLPHHFLIGNAHAQVMHPDRFSMSEDMSDDEKQATEDNYRKVCVYVCVLYSVVCGVLETLALKKGAVHTQEVVATRCNNSEYKAQRATM
jgi:hypothetical protein